MTQAVLNTLTTSTDFDSAVRAAPAAGAAAVPGAGAGALLRAGQLIAFAQTRIHDTVVNSALARYDARRMRWSVERKNRDISRRRAYLLGLEEGAELALIAVQKHLREQQEQLQHSQQTSNHHVLNS